MPLFGRNEEPSAVEVCRHESPLTPRWRGPEVMDDDRQAMGYICHACGAEFPPYLVRDRQLKRRG